MRDELTGNFVRREAGLRDHPALVLNADFRPLSYFPLSLWPWQDAVKAAFQDRVSIVAEYDEVVRSPSIEIPIPSVVVLKDYIKMTFDHVIPRCKGGRTTWENVVAACSSCNLRKGSRTIDRAGMHLMKPPRQPLPSELQNSGRKFPPNHLHESWMDFLYWDAELEA